jgi:cytochrome P450
MLASPRPPGPVVPGFTRIFNLLSPKRVYFDSLNYVHENARKFGGLYGIYIGKQETYVISDPALVHEVLVAKHADFHKAKVLRDAVGGFLGNGLLTSEDDFWRRQRKLAQPAFHHARIAAYADTMAQAAVRVCERWQPGETRDIAHEMMALTLDIVTRTLFGAEVGAHAKRIGELMVVLLEAANDVINAYEPLWEKITQKRARAVLAAQTELSAIVDGIITRRKQSTQEDNGDLLSMLLNARDDEDRPMSEKQLRDEVMTLFVAGHETTANLLAWTFYFLAKHPDVNAKLRAEIATLGGRLPTLQDLATQPYAEMVLKEAMRLYPPAAGATREPVRPVTIGGVTFQPGAPVIITTYAMHRNPALFPDPERFDPERFSAENEPKIPKHAYLPFGGGPRVCIGNMFAMMEAQLALIVILQRWQLSLAPGQVVQAEQLFTVRPRGGLPMRIAPSAQ